MAVPVDAQIRAADRCGLDSHEEFVIADVIGIEVFDADLLRFVESKRFIAASHFHAVTVSLVVG